MRILAYRLADRSHAVRSYAMVLAVVLLACSVPSARALAVTGSAASDVAEDSSVLSQLEEHARHAELREQCYLYTQLVRVYSDIASRQIAAGDMQHAAANLARIQHYTVEIHNGLATNARKLKEAEMILHAASHRLSETIRYVSADDKAALQQTLRQLDRVNDELLALVFAH